MCDFDYARVSTLVDGSDDVFVGDVTAAEPARGDMIWHFDVIERWKGALDATVVTHGEAVSSCTAGLEVGDRVLAFYDRDEGLSLMTAVPIYTDPAPGSFLREAACDLGRGESDVDWHLREEVVCHGCATVSFEASWLMVLLPLALRRARRVEA